MYVCMYVCMYVYDCLLNQFLCGIPLLTHSSTHPPNAAVHIGFHGSFVFFFVAGLSHGGVGAGWSWIRLEGDGKLVHNTTTHVRTLHATYIHRMLHLQWGICACNILCLSQESEIMTTRKSWRTTMRTPENGH